MAQPDRDALLQVAGITADGAGMAVASVRAAPDRLHGLGPGRLHRWDNTARAVLAGPVPAAREYLETTAATLLAALDAVPELLVVEAAPPGIDPAILAEVTGLPVVHTLREADLRLGGAGRPLSPVFHHALATYLGLGRLTLLDLGAQRALLSQAAPEAGAPGHDGALCAFEAGPGLGLLDALASAPRRAKGRQGKLRRKVLDAALQAPHLARLPPKWLGEGDFAMLGPDLARLHPADAAATLRALVAETVLRGLTLLPVPPERLIVTGPGRADAGTLTRLARALPCPVIRAEDAGLPGDVLAAQSIAFLGLRAAHGLPTSFPATTGVAACVGGAEVATPEVSASG